MSQEIGDAPLFWKYAKMRTQDNDQNIPSERVRRGRGMVIGLGLDDSGGHVRYTRGDAFELWGGSEKAHDDMQKYAARINQEIADLGISLERMTYAQYLQICDIVERVNAEVRGL